MKRRYTFMMYIMLMWGTMTSRADDVTDVVDFLKFFACTLTNSTSECVKQGLTSSENLEVLSAGQVLEGRSGLYSVVIPSSKWLVNIHVRAGVGDKDLSLVYETGTGFLDVLVDRTSINKHHAGMADAQEEFQTIVTDVKERKDLEEAPSTLEQFELVLSDDTTGHVQRGVLHQLIPLFEGEPRP